MRVGSGGWETALVRSHPVVMLNQIKQAEQGRAQGAGGVKVADREVVELAQTRVQTKAPRPPA